MHGCFVFLCVYLFGWSEIAMAKRGKTSLVCQSTTAACRRGRGGSRVSVGGKGESRGCLLWIELGLGRNSVRPLSKLFCGLTPTGRRWLLDALPAALPGSSQLGRGYLSERLGPRGPKATERLAVVPAPSNLQPAMPAVSSELAHVQWIVCILMQVPKF